MAEQLSVCIRDGHGIEPEGGSKRNADGHARVSGIEHTVTHIDCDCPPGWRQHAARRFTGAHCDQANASGRRGRDFTSAHRRQWHTKSPAADASCAANRPAEDADHATHAARASILSTDGGADTCSIQRNSASRAPVSDSNPGGAAHVATCVGHTRSHRESLGFYAPAYQSADPVRRGSGADAEQP